jgi:4-hydroxy-3-methylbut-2-en-1-yl diphosphate reductase
MIRTVYLAQPRGFCAGVVMAIEAVERAARENQATAAGNLVVYHAIVHNQTVVERLEQKHQVHFIEDLAELDAVEGTSDTVVFSAHGISPSVRQEANQRGLTTIDATCPLVTKVHSESKKYAALGYHILLIGDSSSHQEIIGTLGEAPAQTTLVSVLGNRKNDPKMADPYTVTVPNPEKIIVLTQTTLSVDDTDKTIAVLKQRFPQITQPSRDDLCYATKNRQAAVRLIAPKVQLFLIITSDYSSNGMRLLELAEELTGNAKRIDARDDIDPAWLVGIERVGISSAASTPDDLVQAVVAHFRTINPDLAVIEEGEPEEIEFRMPERVYPSSAQQEQHV